MRRLSIVLLLCCLVDWSLNASLDPSALQSDPAVVNLRNYLRIRSEHPNINYAEPIAFLKSQADSLGLPYKVYELVPGKPILVMSWLGASPDLPSVLLNSHTDVVPVFEKSWTHPPFEAFMDENGTIYARGIQDMKSVGIQFIEAVRRLKAAGVQLKRTIHLSFVPDEELGGADGMRKFVETEDYKALNVGFALDEGIASADDDYLVYYAERSVWHVDIIATGKSGHGSLLHDNTPGEKIRYIIDKFSDLRAEYKKRLDENKDLTIGDVTTINLTKLRGGVQSNVVPEKMTVTFDIRLAIDVDHKEFEDMIQRICKEAGEGVTYEFEQKGPYVETTKLDDSNPYWLAFKKVTEELHLPIKTLVFPGGTDSRYVRAGGAPALGFSPIRRTPVQLHEHNESLNAQTFLDGIGIFEKIVTAVANV
ncbi:unnamed protein product [Plutella xylostella]|uniref:N-acyl-aliphatic-L-amino acid amidohydrolase n=1 Tax=Plutella xylostella TaxID=51655 RepID=A0A8S4G7Z0_PLUXY|nr:unnamed protein product [Plutella xylostella]